MKILLPLLLILVLISGSASSEEDYSFDLSEIEREIDKKPYSFEGYLEFTPEFLVFDQDAEFYFLNFYNNSPQSTMLKYNFKLLLDARYDKGITTFFVRTNTDLDKSNLEWSSESNIYEGYVSITATPFFMLDFGKKTFKWGTGYVWNPVAFVDRQKEPDDPDQALEGFIVASAHYIKSFSRQLKTVSLTPILLPVYEHINESFGVINKVNFAGRLYLLFYDTDFDFIFLTGGSKCSRLGFDFSRNITLNFEIHGEFSYLNNYKKEIITNNGVIVEEHKDRESYLVGLRYLTPYNTTIIGEYLENGTGFTKGEMKDFYLFIENAKKLYLTSGDDFLLRQALAFTEGNYNKIHPMKNYFYLHISQKDPLDIPYFTPSITGIFNVDDGSFFLSPQLLYRGITNLNLQLKAGFMVGEPNTEYGEKQYDYRIEMRFRYYFDLIKLLS